MGWSGGFVLVLILLNFTRSSLRAQDCPLPQHVQALQEPGYDELRISCILDTLRPFRDNPRSIEIADARYYGYSDANEWRELPDSLFSVQARRAFTYDSLGRLTSFRKGYDTYLHDDIDRVIHSAVGPVEFIQPWLKLRYVWKYDQKGLLVLKEAFLNGFLTGWVRYEHDRERIRSVTVAGQQFPDTTRTEYLYGVNGDMLEAAVVQDGKRTTFWQRPSAAIDSILSFYSQEDTIHTQALVREPLVAGKQKLRWYIDGELVGLEEQGPQGQTTLTRNDWDSKVFHYNDQGRLVRVTTDVMKKELSGAPASFWENYWVDDFVYEYSNDEHGNPLRIAVLKYHHGADRHMAEQEPQIHFLWLFHYSY